MAKPKPKKWSLVGKSKITPSQEKDLIKILSHELGAPLNKELCAKLSQASGLFSALSKKVEDGPYSREIKASLENIHKQSNNLAQSLDEMDTISRGLLRTRLKKSVEAVTSNIYDIHFAAKESMSGIPRRSTTWLRKNYITELITIYKEVKGKWPGVPHRNQYTLEYGGPIFRIVKSCLKIIDSGSPIREDAALSQEIRRVLSQLKLH
ncbi:MAG: hypothetical protein QGG48_09425 [Desulfatiglandales bacterium]|jgi:hypothetical protein|nr:hypothetical protein [Desulfatiglandales bacterium]